MPTMPKGFAPLVSGYSFGGPGGAMRTEVAGGSPRYGLDFDRGAQRFNVSLILESMEFAVWTAFYHQTIKLGTISFDMMLDSGFGAAMHAVNIVPESYSVASLNSRRASVAFVVEAESQAYLFDEASALTLQVLYENYGDFNPLFARLAQFANVDTLVVNNF